MAPKAELSELIKTMDKTTKVVEELKSELIIRKSSRAHQVLDYVDYIGMECCKMSGTGDEIMLKKTKSEFRDTDIKFWSLPIRWYWKWINWKRNLSFELQKLRGHTIDTNCHEEIRPK
ncbi:hypothetical protein CR513_44596, partial [Mucuna pruriens]